MDDEITLVKQRLSAVERQVAELTVAVLKAEANAATRGELASCHDEIAALRTEMVAMEGRLNNRITALEGRLSAEIAALEGRLIRWSVGAIIAVAGVVVTIMKLLS